MLNFLMNAMARLRDEEEGQGVVEYSLILVLISVVAIAVMETVGINVTGVFTEAGNALGGA
jgi:pilus assembly protein Flp/PilA